MTSLSAPLANLLRLTADLVDEVLEGVGISEALLLLVLEVVLADVHPQTGAAELLVLAVREREGEPVLVLRRAYGESGQSTLGQP